MNCSGGSIPYNNRKFLPITIFLLIFIIISSGTVSAGINSFDESVRDLALRHNDGAVGTAMGAITKLGDGKSALAIGGFLPDDEARYDAFNTIMTTGITVNIMKAIIGRRRPPGPSDYDHFTTSNSYHAMPSGHTATAFALAAVIAEHYPDYDWLAYTVAGLVGVSRIFEDEHWATDVLAGAAVGYGSARLIDFEIISW